MANTNISGVGAAQRDPHPVMWISDLHEPVADPDDHYDFAVGMSSSRYRPDLVVIDDVGVEDAVTPAVADLAAATGRRAPRAVMDSDLLAQVQMLRRAKNRSVTIVSLGSLDGLSNLLDAQPALLRKKVRSVMVFAGDAGADAPVEANVAADRAAYVAVMTSGLPIQWVPCFDGGLWQAGTSSYVQTTDEALLRGVRPPVRAWFDRYIGHRLGVRNLWGAGIFTGSPEGAAWKRRVVRLDDDGVVSPRGENVARVSQLVVHDRPAFEAWMVAAGNEALRSL